MVTETGQNLALLLGLPRSGTTLLCAMLANHPRIYCPPEPWILLALEALGKTSHRHPADSQALGEAVRAFGGGEESLPAARAFAATLYNQKLAARKRSFFLDKTPRYYLILPYILRLLPDARLLWLQRNPLAVAASYKTTWGFDVPRLLTSHQDTWVYYDLSIGPQRLLELAREHPGRVHIEQYEQLVQDPPTVLRRVLKHLGLPFVEGLEKLDLKGSEIATAWVGDKKIVETSGPHTRSLDAWQTQFNDEELQTLLDALGAETFRRMGYENVLNKLTERGIKDRGPEPAARLLRRAEAALALRLADVEAVSSADRVMSLAARLGIPPGSLPDDSLGTLLNQLPALRRTISDQNAELTKLRTSLHETSRQLQQQSQQIEQQARQIQNQARQMEEQSRQIQQANQRLHELQKSNAELTERSQESYQAGILRAEVARLVRELVQTQNLLREKTNEAARSATALAARDATVRSLNETVGRAERRAEQADSRLAELQASAHAQRTAAEKELASLRQARRALELDRNSWRGRAQHAEGQLSFIEHLTWYQRIYDTLGRIVKEIVLGRPYVAGPRHRPLPKITIVTPVLNGEAHLLDAIESVLAQNYPNLEYIVVDGGSTDGTMSIVNRFRDRLAKVISEPDQGMYDAIAKGFAAATGDVLGYLNADDMYEPGGLLRVGEFFRDHPKAAVVYHEDSVTVNGWRFPNIAQPHVDMLHLLQKHNLFQDGVFFTRQAYLNVGGFNRRLKFAGDWDLFLKLARRYPFHRNEGHIGSFRVRPGQLSGDMSKYNAELEPHRQAELARLRGIARLRKLPRHWFNELRNFLIRKLHYRRLYFPIPFHNMPPAPAVPPPPGGHTPLCPLTRAVPDRLLFSAAPPDNARRRAHYLYYVPSTQIAVRFPLEGDLPSADRDPADAPGIVPRSPGYDFQSPYQRHLGARRRDRWITRVRLPGRLQRRLAGTWDDRTPDEILASLPRGSAQTELAMLHVGCGQGLTLDALRTRTRWTLHGLEPDASAAARAAAKGHRVWVGSPDDAPYAVPADLSFDVIFLSDVVEHVEAPARTLRRLRQILSPNGRIIVRTPNLDSRLLERFGPTWTHWDIPRHQTIFSRRSISILAGCTDLEVARCSSFTHPADVARSIQINDVGLGVAALPEPDRGRAEHLAAWSKLLWDWHGQGDYLYAVLEARD